MVAEPVGCAFPRERVWLDPARIGVLYAQLGPRHLPAMLDRALNELATVQDDLHGQYAVGDFVGLARSLRRLSRIADHLGLPAIVQIGADVAACVECGDPVALGATWARLMRAIKQLRHDEWSPG